MNNQVLADRPQETKSTSRDHISVRVVPQSAGNSKLKCPPCTVSVVVLGTNENGSPKREDLARSAFRSFHEKHGRHFAIDQNGKVEIPRGEKPIRIAAYNDEYFGSIVVSKKSDDLAEIFLEELSEFKLRILSNEGKPLSGVSASVVILDSLRSWDRGTAKEFFFGKDPAAVCSMKTDALGQVSFVSSSSSLFDNRNASMDYKIEVEDQSGSRFRLQEPFRRGTEHDIEFLIPQPTKLDIEVLDTDGATCAEQVELWVAPYFYQTEKFTCSPFRVSIPNAEVSIPFFVDECKFRYELRGGFGSTIVPVEGSFTSSNAVEKSSKLTIQIKKRLPVIRGRIVDDRGKPVANRKFSSFLSRGVVVPSTFRTVLHDDHFHESIKTNRNGRFEWVPWEYSGWWRKVEERELSIAWEDEEQGFLLAAWIALPSQPMTHDLDVGDVVVTHQRTLVEGVVMSENGEGLEGVNIATNTFDLSNDDLGIVLSPRSIRSDKDGSFKIAGSGSQPFLGLSFAHDEFESSDIVVKNGNSHLQVVLRKGKDDEVAFDPTEVDSLGDLLVRVKEKNGEAASGCSIKVIISSARTELSKSLHGVVFRQHSLSEEQRIADQNGELKIRRRSSALRVMAYTEDEFGVAAVDEDFGGEVVDIDLAEKLSLNFKFTTSDNRPVADKTVTLSSLLFPGFIEDVPPAIHFFGSESFWLSKKTDGHGRVTFQTSKNALNSELDTRSILCLTVPGHSGRYLTCRVDPDAEGEIHVHVPEVALLDFSILESDGSRCREPIELWLTSNDFSNPGGEDVSIYPASERLLILNGYAQIPFHLFNGDIKYEVKGGHDSSLIPFGGNLKNRPDGSGRTSVSIKIPKRLPVVTGRLVDVRGNPIRDVKFDVYLDDGAQRVFWHWTPYSDGSHESFKTNANGEFRWVPWEHSSWDEEVSDRSLKIQCDNRRGETEWIARIALPSESLIDFVSLPDTTSHRIMILASGRVVDGNGKGIAGAEVRPLAGNGHWGDDRNHVSSIPEGVTTKSDGSFVVSGAMSNSVLRLSANKNAIWGDVEIVKKGARGLMVVLKP